MTLENAASVWTSQTIPSLSTKELSKMIEHHNAKSKRQLYSSLAFVVLCLIFGAMNFYGQYFVNGDGLLVATLRFSVVLIAIPIHILVHRRMAIDYRSRVDSASNQRAWLEKAIANLETELNGGWWKLASFFSFVMIVVCLTKWLDYRSGADSLAECVAIPVFVLAVIILVLAAVWHYRVAILAPEYDRLNQLLAGVEDES
ncbi:MAG: hypothetical protein AAGG48_21510 [Planctomycetota bacterium]